MRLGLTLVFGWCATWPAVLLAQAVSVPAPSTTLARYPRGEVVRQVISRTDRQQRYAVYLPSRYTSARRWPLLLLMDPRGQALIPLELVRRSAERYGYIVLSSYNTRSDEAGPRLFRTRSDTVRPFRP